MVKKLLSEEEDTSIGVEDDISKKFKENLLKKFGSKCYTSGDEANLDFTTGWISTGSILLDYIIKNASGGGIPLGRATALIGESQSGKSLILLMALKNVIKKGGIGILIDTEGAIEDNFFKKLDMPKNLIVLPVEHTQDAFEKIEFAFNSFKADVPVVVGWDGIANTKTKAEVDGTYNPTEDIALKAREISKFFRKATSFWRGKKKAFVFTNQVKTAIGERGYGEHFATPGGMAPEYIASLILMMYKMSAPKTQEEKDHAELGNDYCINRIKIIKNRMHKPFRQIEFPFHYHSGIDNFASIYNLFVKYEKIIGSNTWKKLSFMPDNMKEKSFMKKDFESFIKENGLFKNVIQEIEKILIIEDIKPFEDINFNSINEVDAFIKS